jgi:hypothetical protein
MLAIGQLWQHKGMEWLRIRCMGYRDPPSRMIQFKVENHEDPSVHNVTIDFESDYIICNYNMVQHGLDEPSWEV